MEQRIKNITKKLAGLKKNKVGPARILIDPTDRCNLNCLFCWRNDSNQVTEEIRDERLLKLVDEASLLDVKEWIISGGGDPFSRKEIMLELIKKIKKNKMWGQVITNGTLLNEEDIRKIVESGWDQIQISVDGPKKIHDFLRNKAGTFDKVIYNLKCFEKYKKELKKDKPNIGFNVVLCNKNYKYISYLIKLAYKFNCNQVWFEMIAPWSEKARKLQFSEKEKKDLEKYIKKGKALAEKLNIWTNIHYYLPENKTETHSQKKSINGTYCLAPWFSVKIHPTGATGPCCSFYRHESLGNIKNETLNNIWFDGFEKLRKKMLNKNVPKYCEECTEGQKKELDEIQSMLSLIK